MTNMEISWPVPARRGTGVTTRAVPWPWSDVASACAPARSTRELPAMRIAREVVNWLAHMDSLGDDWWDYWDEPQPTPVYADDGESELYGFLFVLGALKANPEWVHARDGNLVDAAFGWFFGHDIDWPGWTPLARAHAADESAGVRATWSPWWRSASIWPEAESVALAAMLCEHLARRYMELGHMPTTAAAAPWLSAWGERPSTSWRVVDALADVLGPVGERWPWPYNCWPAGEVGAVEPEPESESELQSEPPDSMWARDEHR